MAKYLEGLCKYYNHNVKDRFFMVGDMVLRRKQKTEELHKLVLHWESPYMVKAVTRPTSYRLCDVLFLYFKYSINVSSCFCCHLFCAS
jgi:hypothetical protein